MKTVGIIGGLGPETTSKFYLELIFLCQKLEKTHRPEILISSVPIAYDVESDAIGEGKGEERCIPLLVNAAKKLEYAGADFIVMPCNSLHTFIEEIRSSVKIPVLSIVEETTNFLVKNHINELGVIATTLTLNKKLYENAFLKLGIKQFLPDASEQQKIGEIINKLVSNNHNPEDKLQLVKIIDGFEAKGIKNVILACTDLQLLVINHNNLKVYDTMKIFAEATAREILES